MAIVPRKTAPARGPNGRNEIECDYQETGFHFFVRRHIAGWMEQLENYQTEYQLLGEDGFEVGWLDEQEAVLRSGSPVLAGGLAYLSGAQFQSGKFLLRLARGLARLSKVSLCDGGRAEKIEPAGSALRLDTPAGVINSEQVFLAIHALTPPLMPPPEMGLRAQRAPPLHRPDFDWHTGSMRKMRKKKLSQRSPWASLCRWSHLRCCNMQRRHQRVSPKRH